MWMRRKVDAMRRLVFIGFVLLVALSTFVLPAELEAYARCNCTAYAKARRADLPMTLGHARTWAARARAKGFPVDGKPRVGDVIVLQPGVQGAHRRYGHVAYVTAVNGNRVRTLQMNGGRGCRVTASTYRVTRGVSFIHRKGR